MTTQNNRQSLSKKIRFDVFERDSFICQYCGKNPTDNDVTLEVDHAISVKDGGDDSIDNLVTACFDCNRGKGKKSVIKKIKTPKEIEEELKRTKDRLEQIKMMVSFRKKKSFIHKEIQKELLYFIYEHDWFTEVFIKDLEKAILSQYNKGINIEILENCFDITLKKFEDNGEFLRNDFIKYFYGVLRNILSSQENE
jgi:hypothetical protein